MFKRTKGYNTLHLNDATLILIIQDWFDTQFIGDMKVVDVKHPDPLTFSIGFEEETKK